MHLNVGKFNRDQGQLAPQESARKPSPEQIHDLREAAARWASQSDDLGEQPARQEISRRLDQHLNTRSSELDLRVYGFEALSRASLESLVKLLGQFKATTEIPTLKVEFCEGLRATGPGSVRNALTAMFGADLKVAFDEVPLASNELLVSIHAQSAPVDERLGSAIGDPQASPSETVSPHRAQELETIQSLVRRHVNHDTPLTLAADQAYEPAILRELNTIIPLIASTDPAVASAAENALWATNAKGESALSLCVTHGHEDAVRMILGSRPSLDRLGQVNTQGYTVVSTAAKYPHAAIPAMVMNALVEPIREDKNPADVIKAFGILARRTGRGGNTALTWSLSRPDATHRDTVTIDQRLIAQTALLDPLVSLRHHSNPAICSMTREFVNIKKENGQTAMSMAEENGFAAAANALRQLDADRFEPAGEESRADQNVPPLSIHVQAAPVSETAGSTVADQQIALIQFLERRLVNQNSDTSLTLAADQSRADGIVSDLNKIMPLLRADDLRVARAAEAALWATNNKGESVLSRCVAHGHEEAVRMILSTNPTLERLDQTNDQGYSVLLTAGKYPRGNIPAMLMNALVAPVLENKNPDDVKKAFAIIGRKTADGGNTALMWSLARPDATHRDIATAEQRRIAHTAMLDRLVSLLDHPDPVVHGLTRQFVISTNANGDSALAWAESNGYDEAAQTLRRFV